MSTQEQHPNTSTELALLDNLRGFGPEVGVLALDLFQQNNASGSNALLPTTIIDIASEFYEDPEKAQRVASLVASVLVSDIQLDGSLEVEEIEILGEVSDALADRDIPIDVSVEDLMKELGINPELGGLTALFDLRSRIDELSEEQLKRLSYMAEGDIQEALEESRTLEDRLSGELDDDSFSDRDDFTDIEGDGELSDEVSDQLNQIDELVCSIANSNDELAKLNITGLNYAEACSFFGISLDDFSPDDPKPYEDLYTRLMLATDEDLVELMRAMDADVKVIDPKQERRKLAMMVNFDPIPSAEDARDPEESDHTLVVDDEEWDI